MHSLVRAINGIDMSEILTLALHRNMIGQSIDSPLATDTYPNRFMESLDGNLRNLTLPH